MRNRQREILKSAVQQNTHFGHFDLTSGGTSDYYIDVRPVLLNSCTSRAVSMALLERIDPRANVIAGIGVSGALIVSSLLAHSVKDFKGLLVRKDKHKHGLTREIEGDSLIHSCNIVLVDDVLNVGSSLSFATRALKDLRNCNVLQWVVFVDRSTEPIKDAPEISTVLRAAEILEGLNYGKQKQAEGKE